MGTALWIASGVLAGVLARIIPFRRGSVTVDLLVALVAALGGGLIATALDFGGWKEADWRAVVFAFLVALAAVGTWRIARQSP